MRIGLIDFDSKQVNLALMKLSAYHKSQGNQVVLNPSSPSEVDEVFVSVIFSWNREAALRLADIYPRITFGGTGYDYTVKLPPDVEKMTPDYDLYTVEVIERRIKGIMKKETRRRKAEEIVNAGIGRTATGCIRRCGYCLAWQSEGELKSIGTLAELINPRSNIVTLLDNNLTKDPDCLPKLLEAKERNLILDVTQGVDLRGLSPEIAKALSEVKHLRSLHYAFDLMHSEASVTEGIKTLSRFIPKWRHLCFMLVGWDTDHEQDMYRFRRLTEMGVDPYVMPFRGTGGVTDPFELLKIRHFARWVNGRIYTKCPDFNQYDNWIKARSQMTLALV